MIYAVILAGGSGERFWPLSRRNMPKQFLKLVSGKTLIQKTVNQIKFLVPFSNIYIVTNTVLSALMLKQLTAFRIPQENILLEPGSPRNTAPAIGLAAVRILAKDPEATMIVLPSDHFVGNENKFLSALKHAYILASRGNYLIAFGIKPDRPETGYGYIKISPKSKRKKSYQVERFVEKPNKEKAKMFMKDKRYYWNSGIFVFKARTILDEIKRYLPILYRNLQLIEKRKTGLKKIWNELPTVSIDYGVMEKSKKIIMVSLECGWTDLGSWDALSRVIPQDKSGNIICADSIDRDSRNIIVWGKEFLKTDSGRFIATIGLKDLIIVDTPDALLICKKDRAQEVKDIVNELKRRGKEEIL